MITPRFQLPNPDESPNSLKNQTLILRCMQDPLHVVLKNPTPFQQEILLRHVGVAIPSVALEMIMESLRSNSALDRSVLSQVAEVSKATIEEATSLVWHDNKPELTRYFVITSPSNEQSHDEDRQLFSSNRFQLTIDQTSTGDIEVALGWENGDCAESLAGLNERWEKINKVYHSLGKPVLPWDLLPIATERRVESHDDEYVFEGLTLVAYPMDLDVMLEDVDPTGRDKTGVGSYETASDRDEEEDDENEYGLFDSGDTLAPDIAYKVSGDADADIEEDSSEADYGRDEDHLSMPGDDITIIDPTPKQLTAIAKLSFMPVTRDLMQRLMMLTYENAHIEPSRFESVPKNIRESICIHRRATYILDRTLTETHRYSLDECDIDKPTMFSISLFRQRSPTSGRPDYIKSVLHWEQFSPDCQVANWERIVEIARKRK